MKLSDYDIDSAFVAYCLAYGGTVFFIPLPDFGTTDATIVAGAIALGAEAKADGSRPLGRVEVAAAVEALLSADPPASAPTADHDPTADRIAGYAEGRAAELEALEGWIDVNVNLDDDGEPAVYANDLRAQIASRRAMAPKPGMTALGVVMRVARFLSGNKADDDCEDTDQLLAKIRRELEAAR